MRLYLCDSAATVAHNIIQISEQVVLVSVNKVSAVIANWASIVLHYKLAGVASAYHIVIQHCEIIIAVAE
jgi:hypothetical protein